MLFSEQSMDFGTEMTRIWCLALSLYSFSKGLLSQTLLWMPGIQQERRRGTLKGFGLEENRDEKKGRSVQGADRKHLPTLGSQKFQVRKDFKKKRKHFHWAEDQSRKNRCKDLETRVSIDMCIWSRSGWLDGRHCWLADQRAISIFCFLFHLLS